jgi:quercetin dioxygenase-like cupin family protein
MGSSLLSPLRHRFARPTVVVGLLTLITACRHATSRMETIAGAANGNPRPAVIAANEGERRFLRGGATPLLIKIDPITTGSRRMVLGSSDLPPGDAIAVHRHLREDEIIFITRGTARVQLGAQFYTARAGGTVFIPQGTCIAVANIGTDTLSNVFIFSAPGFEQVLRAVSSAPGAPPITLSPAQRATAFQHGHAEAGPSDC